MITMCSLGKTIIVVVLCTLLSGCTIHFKAKEVELDSVSNLTYELEKIDFAKR